MGARIQDDSPDVHILMGVKNGATCLPEQLDSLRKQTVASWSLTCSDDGSTDTSVAVIAKFAKSGPQSVNIVRGPCSGFAKNYLSMIRSVRELPDFLAFADQDDIWFSDKLERAILALSAISPTTPALYCARRWVWNPEVGCASLDGPAQCKPSFRNALIENIAPGNTIVLNTAAVRLVHAAAHRVDDVFAHDWWMYQLISGVDGNVIFDPEPCLFYRQHGENAIGSGHGWQAQVARKIAVLRGAYIDRLSANILALQQCRDVLAPVNVDVLEDFETARQSQGLARIVRMARLQPNRQSKFSTVSFWGALLLGKI